MGDGIRSWMDRMLRGRLYEVMPGASGKEDCVTVTYSLDDSVLGWPIVSTCAGPHLLSTKPASMWRHSSTVLERSYCPGPGTALKCGLRWLSLSTGMSEV